MHKARIDYGQDATGSARNDDFISRPSGNRLETFGGYTRIRWIRTPGHPVDQDQIGPTVFSITRN